jgi:hypothetical protein
VWKKNRTKTHAGRGQRRGITSAFTIPNMTRTTIGDGASNRKPNFRRDANHRGLVIVLSPVGRFCVVLALALVLPATALGANHKAPVDRPAINALLDKFIPDVVEGKNLAEGWNLAGGYARTVSHRDWLRGDTPIQRYPAKGTTFHGWTVNYSSPTVVGFDILLQPRTHKLGAWSFRAEARKIAGRWRITTWYVVAQFAPRGHGASVLGPNDFGPGSGSGHLSNVKGRVPSWVLILPLVAIGVVGLLLGVFGGVRYLRRRSRVRAIERDLAA